MADDEKTKAPHGRDEQGTPLAPYGYKVNGDPKISNRGRAPAPPKKGTKNTRSGQQPRGRTHSETRTQLIELFGMVTTPLAAASDSPVVRKRLGDRQAMALAGDALIIDAYAPPLVDGVMKLAESKPGLLAWMDKAEDVAPYLMLAQVTGQLAKTLIGNHLAPDPNLAAGGRNMAKVRVAKHAAWIEQESRAMGLVDEGQEYIDIPQQRAA